MADRKKLELALELLLNEEEDAAKEALHDFFVQSARKILEDIELEEADDEEEFDDDDMGMGDDLEDEISDDEDGEEEMFGDDDLDDEAEDDLEDSMDDDEDIEDRVEDLEDALAELQAEFEEISNVEEDEHDMDFDDDGEVGDDDDMDDFDDDDLDDDMEDDDDDLDDDMDEIDFEEKGQMESKRNRRNKKVVEYTEKVQGGIEDSGSHKEGREAGKGGSYNPNTTSTVRHNAGSESVDDGRDPKKNFASQKSGKEASVDKPEGKKAKDAHNKASTAKNFSNEKGGDRVSSSEQKQEGKGVGKGKSHGSADVKPRLPHRNK